MYVYVHGVLLFILLIHVQVTVTACHQVLIINLLTLTGQPSQCQSVVGRVRLLPVWVESMSWKFAMSVCVAVYFFVQMVVCQAREEEEGGGGGGGGRGGERERERERE